MASITQIEWQAPLDLHRPEEERQQLLLQQQHEQQLEETLPADSQPSVQSYHFPTFRLRQQEDPRKTPLVLVNCGSFSPITIMHLRMCEMASDWVRMVDDEFEVVAIYLSPVSDAYKKAGLAAARHRVRMCQLAVEETTNCVMVDPWEAIQPQYVPTAKVLDHFNHEINEVLGGIPDASGNRRKARIALLAGADLLQTMSTPGLWSPDDLERILGEGIYVVERAGADAEEARASLPQWKDRISIIPQGIPIDLSSTKVRLYLKKSMSVRYFVPEKVIDYIRENHLYGQGKDEQPAIAAEAQYVGKGKEKESAAAGSSSVGSSSVSSSSSGTPAPAPA